MTVDLSQKNIANHIVNIDILIWSWILIDDRDD